MERIVSTILRFVQLEELETPDIGRIFLVEKPVLDKNWVYVYEGVYVNLESESIAIVKSTYDNDIFRILVGVFVLSLYKTYGTLLIDTAVKLARKYFFKTIVSVK